MAEKKRYTVILRGDIRVEVESHNFGKSLDKEFNMMLENEEKWNALDTGEGFCFRMDDVLAVLESSAITTPVYESVQQTEETEWEQGERMRKAGVDV